MSPALTIAVPFYKNSAYLRRAVASILAQTKTNWTILIVDNSVDPSEHQDAVALASSCPDDLVRYARNDDHLDACGNFNRCIELANTDLVAILHGDDEVLPCYAEEIMGLATRHPEAAAVFAAVRIIDKDSRYCFSFVDWVKQFLMPKGSGDFKLSGESSLRSLCRGNWLNAGGVCFRKSALGDLRWDSSYQMTADLDLWSRIILSDGFIAGTRSPAAYLYRRHTSQTTAELSESLYRFKEEALILDVLATRAEGKGWHSAAATARAKSVVQLHLLFLAMNDLLRGSVRRASDKVQLLFVIRHSKRSRNTSLQTHDR